MANAEMNDDIWSAIVGFVGHCSIDSRRVLGLRPCKLQRDTDFDEKLQAIHRGITRDYRTHFGDIPLPWVQIRLNGLLLVNVTDTSSGVWLYWSFGSRTKFSAFSCTIAGNGDIRAELRLDLPLSTGRFVFPTFVNGKWRVRARQDYTPQDRATLAQLGYTLSSKI